MPTKKLSPVPSPPAPSFDEYCVIIGLMKPKIRFYNTSTRKKEIFKPLNPPHVGMYTCGPTVYGPGHLGHARTYTNFDILKRVLKFNGLKVEHVLNITDVHDDMIKRANERGITIFELAEEYIPQFYTDLEALNIQPADVYPRVTEHIDEIKEMIQTLIEKDYAYVGEDGSVYYQVSKFKDYGKLSGIKLDQAKVGTRVDTDKYEKEDSADFALWKAWKEGEPFWDSPWGKGRPGWHIECSVMAKEHLGETIDIHGGAMDLKFPHHENEIAQSEAANGVKFASFWIHAGLLEVAGQKMAKSLGNIYTLADLNERGFAPLAFRYLCLTAHYRSKLNFTWEALQAAQTALNRLREFMVAASLTSEVGSRETSEVSPAASFSSRFLEAVNDDLNMPGAVALVWDLVKSDCPTAEKHATLLKWDRILGLRLGEIEPVEIPEDVKKLVSEREKLRAEKKWKEADAVRGKIERSGFGVEDTEEGPKLCLRRDNITKNTHGRGFSS